MSNDLALFEQSQVPDYIRSAGVDDLTKALGGGSSGVRRISLRGKKFRMVVNGEEITKSNSDRLNIVVVNGTRYVSRKYYAGAYQPGESLPPDCWSNDGQVPDASIEAPQHSNCQDCPMNIKGSGQGGSRACRFEKRLAVVLADDISGPIYQLALPSKSYFGRSDDNKAMPFEQYAKYIAHQGYNINQIVTEMRMDDDSDTAKVTFRPVSFLNEGQWEVAKRQANTPEAKSAVVMTPYQADSNGKTQKLEAPKAAKAAPAEVEEAEEIAEPVKRAPKKAAPEATAKKDLASIMSDWADDE
jgi:hypothetical protein